MNVTGIVLAGGRSSRFAGGSVADSAGGSKLDADLAGRTVLDRTIDAVSIACGEVLVVGRATGSHPAAHYFPDPEPFQGPLAGLLVGLEAATRDVAVIVGGDMPLLKRAVLDALIDRLTGDGSLAATGLHDAGVRRPLPLAVRCDVAASEARAVLEAGERSLHRFLDGLPVAFLASCDWRGLDPDGDTLLDVDRPVDLAEARQRLAKRAT